MSFCPLCGQGDLHFMFRKHGFPVLECQICEFQFAMAKPSEEHLRTLYSKEYFVDSRSCAGYLDYVGEEATHRRQAQRYLARLTQEGIQPSRLLDVGCAAGYFIDEAKKAGWEVIGCDISEYAAQHASSLGLRVVQSNFLSANFDGAVVDLITLFNVLEHLPEPLAVAAKLRGLLRPNGLLVIETWDCDSLVARLWGRRWHEYTPPYVLSYFNRVSLLRLFDPEYWRLRSYKVSAKWITLRRGLSILGIFDRLGRSRLGRAEVPYMLGDLVFAIFERAA